MPRFASSVLARVAAPGLYCAASLIAGLAQAGAAPDWMHAQVAAPLPAHDDKTNAVLLYSETVVTVSPDGKINKLERKVFKILRPDGAARATIGVLYNGESRIVHLRAWCIPVSGKDFDLSERDAVDVSVDGAVGTFVGDLRVKQLRIPAALPGSIIGYESQTEQRPFVLEDEWRFQDTVPVREARYRLHLPPGWSYKATWLNHEGGSPAALGSGESQWMVANIDPVKVERHMPPWRGIAGGLVVVLLPPGGKDAGFQTWGEFGDWYLKLAAGRRDASPQIKQKVIELTSSLPSVTARIQALASFVQTDIRYVGIELGIGGYQPHTATEIFIHGYGDCKDKATLLSAMLAQIGVDSYYVIINSERGAVTAVTPPNLGFNHAILAIGLPQEMADAELPAHMAHPTLGNILFFDPTDSLTPFGRIRGALQANFGVLIAPRGGGLVQLPQLPANANVLDRTARMTLDDKGTLRGEVHESWTGDRAATQRNALRTAPLETDRIKPVEARIGASLTHFEVLSANISNLRAVERPFLWNYSIEAQDYAKVVGDLLVIRPRLLGFKASPLPESTEPRLYPVEFDEPVRDTDVFEFTLPSGYRMDELPAPVHVEADFGSYDSRTEMIGNTLRYTRSFELRNLSLPAARIEELRNFYGLVARDERASAVFKRVVSQ